jgi:hypothetical protein
MEIFFFSKDSSVKGGAIDSMVSSNEKKFNALKYAFLDE